MAEPLLAALVIALAAAATGVGLPAVLRRLPEPPADRPEGELDDQPADRPAEPAKIAYADLARPGFVAGAAAAAAVAAAISAVWLPPTLAGIWLVLAVFGVSLAAIDGATTWLPMRLSYAGWIAMAAAITVTALVTADGGLLVRAVLGAVVAGALHLVIWVVSRGGLGFGDVRFAPLLGAAAASSSWTLLFAGLLCGALIGGAFGVFRIVLRRPGGFPYAPSMLAGVYLGAVLTLPGPLG